MRSKNARSRLPRTSKATRTYARCTMSATLTIRTTTYAGNYERIDSAGHSREFYFLDDGIILFRETGQQDRILYAFRDNLGSYLKLYDEQGQAVLEAEYDAWGRQSRADV